MPYGVPDTRQFPWDQSLSNHLKQLSNGVTGGINTWAVDPTVGVDGLALGINHVGYTGINTDTDSLNRWDGSNWVTILDGVRLVNNQELDVYVSQVTGNDSNNGKSSSTAWKTISKFYQEVAKYNLLGKTVNLYLGAGTYSILLPPSTGGVNVRVRGVSNSSVTIQSISVTSKVKLTLTDVTLQYPELLSASTNYVVLSAVDSTVTFGNNVILGPISTFRSGALNSHVALNNSTLVLLANSPVSITGSTNYLLIADNTSSIISGVYYSPTAGEVSPNLAPVVNTGVVISALGSALTSADTVATLNAVGSISVDTLMLIRGSSSVNGAPLWKINFTGNITGRAYSLSGSSSIAGLVAKGSVPTQGIGFPNSISSGSMDSSSTVTGTPF